MTNNTSEDTSIILNHLFDPLYEGKAMPWKDKIKDLVLPHIEDYNNFIDMFENLQYNYQRELFPIKGRVDTMCNALAGSGSKTSSEVILAMKDVIQTQLDLVYDQ